jgi:hypothetical protein
MNSVNSVKITLLIIFSLFISNIAKADIVVGSPTLYSTGSYDSVSNSFVICSGEAVIFDYVAYSTLNEEINIDAGTTNLDSLFGPGNWVIMPNVASPYRNDSMQILLQVQSSSLTPPFYGVHSNANIGIATATESYSINFNFISPGITVSSTSQLFCADVSQSIELVSSPNSVVVTIDSTSWIQTYGVNSDIISPDSSTTDISVSALSQYDSLIFECTAYTTPDPITGAFCVVNQSITVYANLSASTGTDVQSACGSYNWIDGNTYTSNNNSATHILTNSVGCDSVDTLNLTVNNADTSVTQNGELLTANATGGTYQWLNYPEMTSIPSATNQSYTASENGNYVVVVNNNGCTDTSSYYTVSGLGIIENDFGNEFVLYPNPTKGNFSVDLGKIYNTVKISLMDLNGKLIESNNYNESRFLNLEMKKPAGVYLLTIESGEKKAIIRLIKE